MGAADSWYRSGVCLKAFTVAAEDDPGDPGDGPTVDRTPPVTTATGLSDVWRRAQVVVTFSGTDEDGGSGVAYTEYSVDGAPYS